MARRVQSQSLALLVLLAAAQADGGTLASYGFDDDRIETGPDTFRVFEYGKGSVALTSRYHWSGYRAVELREEPHDGDFAELQGYFTKRETGRLYFHFALMAATPREELNIALAGPSCFKLEQHGIAFWLSSQNGWLFHHSDSIPKKLFELQAFTWYGVDVRYDIPKGTYDLVIQQEGRREPLVRLAGQPNVINAASSAIDKFSFIGDLADQSRVNYFVDDVVIGVDGEVPEIKFAAPGRKKLFVDEWKETRKLAAGKLYCPGSYELADFGILRAEQADLKRSGAIGKLKAILIDPSPVGSGSSGNARVDAILSGAHQWVQGCRQLANEEFDGALRSFDRTLELLPRAKIAELSRLLALAGLKRWEDFDSSSVRIGGDWRYDPRYALVLGQSGLSRKDLAQAARVLEGSALEELNSPKLTRRQVLTEQYFDVLLWSDRCREAEDFALSVAAKLKPSGSWVLRAGDAALLCGSSQRALTLYQQALESSAPRRMGFERLSDAYYRVGDAAREREYREKLYGSLREDKPPK